MYNKRITLALDKTLGYQYFMDKDHPLASKIGRVYYHRHVASIARGSWLTEGEVVHHKNEDKLDNSPENLEIITQAEHSYLHKPRERRPHPCEQCGKPTLNKRFCSYRCSQLSTRRVARPSKEQLLLEIAQTSYRAVGRKYGVSDVAVRKWLR